MPTSHVDPQYSAHLRAIAQKVAQSVHDPLVKAFRSSMDLSYKADRRDIVTVHDKAAEVMIVDQLLSLVPESQVVGEEGGVQGEGELRWFVDPIDGTANFACGLPSWCVSIGAVMGDEIVAGAIWDPMGGNMYSADFSGAYLGDTLLKTQATPDQAYATLLASYPSARDFKADGKEVALDRFGRLTESFSGVRRNGSAALGLAHVAVGWADCAIGAGVNPWDVAAAILILEKSGGTYRPINWDAEKRSRPSFEAPGYAAIGAGGDYPMLLTIAEEIENNRSCVQR